MPPVVPEDCTGANEKPCVVEPVLKENDLTGSELGFAGVDVTPNVCNGGWVLEFVTVTASAAPNWNNPEAPVDVWGWGFKDPADSVFCGANWNVPVAADAVTLAVSEPKLNDPAGVVAGPAAFARKANGATAVVLAGAAGFTPPKLNGEGARVVVVVVLAAWAEAAVVELEAAPNWNVGKLDPPGARGLAKGLLTVTDDPESPVEVAAADDGVAAPKVKGDGAPDGAAKENPEPPGLAVDKTQW